MALLFSLIFVYTSEEVFEASHTHWCPLFICIPFLTHLVLVWTLQTICFLLFCIALMSHRCKIWVTAYFLSMGAFFFLSSPLHNELPCQNFCMWPHKKSISLYFFHNSHRSLGLVHLFCFVFVCLPLFFLRFSCFPCFAFWNTSVTV